LQDSTVPATRRTTAREIRFHRCTAFFGKAITRNRHQPNRHSDTHARGGHPYHDLRSSTIGPSVIAPQKSLRAAIADRCLPVNAVSAFARTSMFSGSPHFPLLPQLGQIHSPAKTMRGDRLVGDAGHDQVSSLGSDDDTSFRIHPFDGATFCGGRRCCQANRHRGRCSRGIMHGDG